MNTTKTAFLGVFFVFLIVLMGCTQEPATQENNAPENNNPSNTGGTNMTETVQNGDTIKVNYRGTLDDGTEFDSSLKPGRTPLEFAVGAGQMIKGFDAAVVGMALNEEKTVTLEPADAYGETNPEMIQEFSKEAFGELFDQLTIGQQIQASNGLIGVVLEKTDSTAKLDFNHELAGKKLTFWIQIVEIQKA